MAQRIVVNKHFNDSSRITADKFLSDGEIIISNEFGFEGIYVRNTNGDVVRIGNGGSSSGGSSSDVTREWVQSYLRAQSYMTSADTQAMINESISGITIDPISEEEVRMIVSEEIAEIIDSADTRFDTLKEIADWIISDTTGAAKMANDIAAISSSTSDNKSDIESLSAETESLRNYIDEYSGNTEALEELRQYIDDQIASVSKNGDHVFLSRAEYDFLVKNGSAVISGETVYYKDYIYYCIYEGDEPYSGSTGGTAYEVSGDTIIFHNAEVNDNGMIVLDADVTNEGFINLDSVAPTPVPPSGDEDLVVDENGNVQIDNPVLDENGMLDLSNYSLDIIE